MTAPNNLRQIANQEISKIQQKLDRANFDIAKAQEEMESLKLILTEIKWWQEQDEVERAIK